MSFYKRRPLRGGEAVVARAGGSRPVHLRLTGPLFRVLPGLLKANRAQAKSFHVGDPQGPHAEPGRDRPLRSADPTDVPEINFHYFNEGTDLEGPTFARSSTESSSPGRSWTPSPPCAAPKSSRDEHGHGARGEDVRARRGLGAPRVVHVQDGPSRRPHRRRRQRLPRIRHPSFARGGRIRLPADYRVIHRCPRVHGKREGERRNYPGRGEPATA